MSTIHRKLAIRRSLMMVAGQKLDGAAAYVPFIGEGDLAAELYADRPVWGADIDAARVATAQARLENAAVVVHDCDRWPFPGVRGPFGIGDFDAYAYPYDSWRAFAGNAELGPVFVAFFTDGQRSTIQRNGIWRHPDGTKHKAVLEGTVNSPDARVTRKVHAMWMARTIRPWWETEVEELGYQVLLTRGYTRRHMLYWGSVIEKKKVRAR